MDVQLLVPYQEYLSLLDLCLCGFLGDIDSGNVYPCTTLIVALLAVRPPMFADIIISASEGL